MTWVLRSKNSLSMELVADEVTRTADENIMLVIPVGLVFESAEKEHPKLNLIMVDEIHLTAVGTYLMAATIK